MSKRKVQFAETDEGFDYESAKKLLKDVEESGEASQSRFKEKHSLDSDEEDADEDKYDVMKDDDIEGFY